MMFVNVVANPVGFNGSEKIPLTRALFESIRRFTRALEARSYLCPC